MSRHDDFWLECQTCGHKWIDQPYNGEYETLCPECDSSEFEIGSEYRPFRIQSFWVALLIHNLILFGGLS